MRMHTVIEIPYNTPRDHRNQPEQDDPIVVDQAAFQAHDMWYDPLQAKSGKGDHKGRIVIESFRDTTMEEIMHRALRATTRAEQTGHPSEWAWQETGGGGRIENIEKNDRDRAGQDQQRSVNARPARR